MVLCILSISFSSCHPLFSCPLKYTSSIKSSYLTQLRQTEHSCQELHTVLQELAGNSVHVLESSLERQREKDRCQNCSLLPPKAKGETQTAPAGELQPNNSLSMARGHYCLAKRHLRTAHKCSLPPPASKKHCHGQRYLLHY